MRSRILIKLINQTGLMIYAALIILLAVLALFGSSFAAEALLFVMVALMGIAVGYIAITDDFPSWLQGTAGGLAVVTMAGWSLLLASVFLGAGWDDRIQLWELGSRGNYAHAFAFGLFVVVARKLLFPSLFPDDPEEAKRRGHSERRNVLIIGSLIGTIVVVVLLIFGLLALISYLAAWIIG